MLLVHDHEGEVFEARKDGGAGAYENVGAPFVNGEPVARPLSVGEFGVQHGHGSLGKAAPNPVHRLRRQIDFGDEKENLSVLFAAKRLLHPPQIHLGFARSRDAEEKEGFKVLGPIQSVEHRFLLVVQFRHRHRTTAAFEGFSHPFHHGGLALSGRALQEKGQTRERGLPPGALIVARRKTREAQPFAGQGRHVVQDGRDAAQTVLRNLRPPYEVHDDPDHAASPERDEHSVSERDEHVLGNLVVEFPEGGHVDDHLGDQVVAFHGSLAVVDNFVD